MSQQKIKRRVKWMLVFEVIVYLAIASLVIFILSL